MLTFKRHVMNIGALCFALAGALAIGATVRSACTHAPELERVRACTRGAGVDCADLDCAASPPRKRVGNGWVLATAAECPQ